MDAGLTGFLKKLPLQPQKLISIEQLNGEAFVLNFQRTSDFLPGQVVGVTVDASIPPRLYSICSGNNEPNLSILFNVKHDGVLSPKLAKLTIGDSLLVSTPFGAFLGDEKPAWWIASGTGVAPFRSMLRSGMGGNKTLIHGGRTVDSFYFENEMKVALAEKYIRCCSQEKGNGYYYGRLTSWLNEQAELPKNQSYYLCGSAEMVVEVRDILIGKGVEIDRIMAEIYF